MTLRLRGGSGGSTVRQRIRKPLGVQGVPGDGRVAEKTMFVLEVRDSASNGSINKAAIFNRRISGYRPK